MLLATICTKVLHVFVEQTTRSVMEAFGARRGDQGPALKAQREGNVMSLNGKGRQMRKCSIEGLVLAPLLAVLIADGRARVPPTHADLDQSDQGRPGKYRGRHANGNEFLNRSLGQRERHASHPWQRDGGGRHPDHGDVYHRDECCGRRPDGLRDDLARHDHGRGDLHSRPRPCRDFYSPCQCCSRCGRQSVPYRHLQCGVDLFKRHHIYLYCGRTPKETVAGTITCTGTTATLTPTTILDADVLYTATLTTGITDSYGDSLAANHAWTFTTAPPPTVISTVPAKVAISVPANQVVSATFSEAMNPATISSTTFTLTGPGGTVAGTVKSPSTTSATFSPTADLASNAVYTATITTGAQSTSGVGLASNYVWTFTTAAAPTVAQFP